MKRIALAVLGALMLHGDPARAESMVTDVASPPFRERRQVRLGDSVWVRVSSLAELRRQESEAKTPMTLWIDGRDTKLTAKALNDSSHWIRFRLDRNADNRDLWSELLYDPFSETTREITLAVGAGTPLRIHPAANPRLTLLKIMPSHAAAWLAALLALVILFIWVARSTDIVRNGPRVSGERQPYSLGRIQMAWWFILILSGFVAIALISGDEASITPSLLALMGISAATALGSAAVPAKPPAAGGVPAPLARSENWFYDMVKDEEGTIALHRLQIVVWTIVLGIMFITSVCRTLAMPEFSGTLLALMGISGGTYLGFKIQGNS